MDTATPTADLAYLLAISTPALIVIYLITLIALAAWHRRIRNTPITGPAGIAHKATRTRQHARAMIAWHTLGALTLTAAFGLLSWPTALAAVPVLILPALGIRKWGRTARAMTHVFRAPEFADRAQLTR